MGHSISTGWEIGERNYVKRSDMNNGSIIYERANKWDLEKGDLIFEVLSSETVKEVVTEEGHILSRTVYHSKLFMYS